MSAAEIRERAPRVRRQKAPSTHIVEGLMGLRPQAWFPTDSVRRATPDLWNGEVSLRQTPTTIDATIQAATIHLTVMDVDSTEPGALPGYASHPVNRRLAIRHVLIPSELKDQAINGDDPVVARRRLGEVPATIDAPALLQRFFQQATLEVIRERAYSQLDATIRGDRSTPPQADVEGIRTRYEKMLKDGANPDRAAFEAIIDLVDAVWTARDEKIDHTRRQKNTHNDWMAHAGDAEKEHAAAIEADRPRGFDGRPIERNNTGEPNVVFEFADYEHLDAPVG